MGINFDPKNLNAVEIFARLDAADGDADDKIKRSVWDQFAEVAEGNNIQNYIEKDNAIAAIERYLQKLNNSAKEKVAEFLNKDIEVKQENINKGTKKGNTAVQTFNTGDPKLDKELEAAVRKGKTSPRNQAKKALLDEYGTNREQLLGDIRGIIDVDTYELKTTKAERKKALKAKGSKGYTYVQAMAIKRDFEEEAINRWREKKKAGDGQSRNSNAGLWRLGVSMQLHEASYLENADPEIAAKYRNQADANRQYVIEKAKDLMPDEEVAKYEAAMADINELESKYTNIKDCYKDLQMEYFKI